MFASSRVTCHYCGATASLSRKGKGRTVERGTLLEFNCTSCDQLNRLSATGEVLPNDPRDSLRNQRSFSKRASPSPFFPTVYATSPFCNSCSRNQSLQTQLIANYPDSDDEGDHLLPQYLASLEQRYPVCCTDCDPTVQNILRDREYKAKAAALGGRLRSIDGLRNRDTLQEATKEGWDWVLLGLVWRVRGLAWWSTSLGAIVICAFVARDPTLLESRHQVAILLLCLSSILWSFYDPTWNEARLARARGRIFTVVNRSNWIKIQSLVYLVRLALALLYTFLPSHVDQYQRRIFLAASIFFAVTLAASLRVLQLKRPMAVRLSTTPARPLPAKRPSDELVPLASLSLSRFPVSPPPSQYATPPLRRRPPSTAPAREATIFGDTSFGIERGSAYDTSNAMDWAPSPAASMDFDRLAPQRLFPSRTTGLEEILATSLRVDDVMTAPTAGPWWRKWI